MLNKILVVAFAAAFEIQTPAAHAAAGTQSAVSFASASDEEKEAMLRALQLDSVSSVDEIKTVLTSGLNDRNPSVRRAALVAFSLRSLPRNQTGVSSSDVMSRYREERQAWLAMNARVLVAMDDNDREVRSAALDAASQFEYEFVREGTAVRILHHDLGRALIARFAAESDPSLRGRIINVLAWFHPDATFAREGKDLVVRALSDRSAAARAAAAQAVLYNQYDDLFPAVVKLLSDADEAVRSWAVNVIGQFGAPGRQFLPNLQTALINESSALVRRNIEIAITTLSR